MNEEEIKEAAYSASMRVGQERKEFIQGSYPKEDWEAIVRMCNRIDDMANNAVEERAFEPCIYNMGKSYEY